MYDTTTVETVPETLDPEIQVRCRMKRATTGRNSENSLLPRGRRPRGGTLIASRTFWTSSSGTCVRMHYAPSIERRYRDDEVVASCTIIGPLTHTVFAHKGVTRLGDEGVSKTLSLSLSLSRWRCCIGLIMAARATRVDSTISREQLNSTDWWSRFASKSIH